MRLWHYKIIPYLPDRFIIAQWRECVAIKRQWEKGTLKNKLVTYVMQYDKSYFFNYVMTVVTEMNNRGIKYKSILYNEIFEFCKEDLKIQGDILPSYDEHNSRYMIQCYFNLEEKATRGILTTTEWLDIRRNINVATYLMNHICEKKY